MWINQPNWGEIQYQRDRENDARVEKQQRIDRYNEMLQDAFKTAPTYGINYAHSIGVNPDDPRNRSIIDQIVSNIQTKAQPNQDSTINPHSFFSPEAFQEGFTDFQSRQRQSNAAKVRNAFAPGLENTLMPDSDIDSIVDSILNEQRGLASTTLDYQSKRGLLTPQGSEQARKSLDNQSQAARSTLSGLATGALDKDRQSLRDIISEADSYANNWMLGQSEFDPTPFTQRLQSKAERERAGLGGDVRAALGDTNLFNIPSIVAQAGTAQGAQNLTASGGEQSILPKTRRSTIANRGLGSGGGGF